MAKIISFDTLQKFYDSNLQVFESNYFRYYHLTSLIESLDDSSMDVYRAFNIFDDTGNYVICLHVTGILSLYSDKWTSDILEQLVNEIELLKFTNFQFIGTRNLIIELFEKSNVKFNIAKDRIIYECTKTLPPAFPKKGEVENGTRIDFLELVEMSFAYYNEEYGGKGLRTINDMGLSVQNGIEQGNLFFLRANGQICSILQIVNDGGDGPLIGNFYTKPEFRNKGYGYSLLHTVTEGYLSNGSSICGLISDVTNIASNKLFLRVGYVPTYKWVYIFKELQKHT